MSRSDPRLALFGTLTVLAVAGCAEIAGMQDVVVVEEVSSDAGRSPEKTTTDAGAATSTEREQPVTDAGAKTTTADAAVDAGPSNCSGIRASVCADPDPYGSGRGFGCSDECDCAPNLWCMPYTTYSPAGRCCANAPCGSPCSSGCDCGSGQCVAGKCL